MDEQNFTIIDEGRIAPIRAAVSESHVRLSPATLRSALGWELKPQGLCKDDQCVPVNKSSDRINADGLDLAALAQLIDRPLALDIEERIAGNRVSGE